MRHIHARTVLLLASSGAVLGSAALTALAVGPQAKEKAQAKATKTTKPAKPAAGGVAIATGPATPMQLALGKRVFDAQGCYACHAMGGKGGTTGPDLTNTGADPKHTPKWLETQILNPKTHTPSTIMPAYAGAIKAPDLSALTLFLTAHGAKSADPATGGPQGAIQNARRRWVGKKLWVLKRRLAADPENASTFTVKKFSPVTVLGMGYGFDTAPELLRNDISYRVRTQDGKTGWMGVNIEPWTETNADSELPKGNFADCFLTFDPKKKYKWSRRVWSALENGQVFIGMNKTQAKLSWGEPDEINSTTTAFGTHEQWVYGMESFIYFDNGRLTSIQN